MERSFMLSKRMRGQQPPSAERDGIDARHARALSGLRQMVKALQDVGAGLLLGVDAGAFWGFAPDLDLMIGSGSHEELAALVRARLTPYQALATGTRNVATFFGTLDETGTVAVGKRADLVLLQDNPLQDIRHTTQIAGVMLGGRWLSRTEIDRRLAAMTAPVAAAP
jgi:imidazolonepropionase-like amidohydrolase